jgi:RimJ/RimL family protein N-acetyltransferase
VGVVVLDTHRLQLRRWCAADLAPMARINADPEVMRYIGDGLPLDEAETAAMISAYEQFWESTGYGRFAVVERETGALVGFAGMAVPVDVPDIMPSVEIGWRFARTCWGRGYATEAARAALGFAFDVSGLDRMVALHVIGNDASARVMTKLGMQPVLDTIEVQYHRPVRVYAVRRDAYRSMRR